MVRRLATASALALVAACVARVVVGCGSFSGSDGSDTDASDDGAPGSPLDAGAPDGMSNQDGGADYGDIADSKRWTAIDIGNFVSGANAYAGGAFDGRYVYLTPSLGSRFVRFDTTQPTANMAAWELYDLGSSDRLWQSCAFDGRYVVSAPYATQSGGLDNDLLVRFDTSGSFMGDGGAAWSTYDLPYASFSGIGRAAKHLYMTPFTLHPLAEFGNESPEAGADYPDVIGNQTANGGVFVNGWYYFAPYYVPGQTPVGSGLVVRVHEGFSGDGGIESESFDYSKNNSSARGFNGAVTDGTYVYFVPYWNYDFSGYHGTVLRFDTRKALSDLSAWTTFDIPSNLANAAALGFAGGAFDGRYIYFVPNVRSVSPFTLNSTLVRFDTTRDYLQASSWETYDLTKVTKNGGGYLGAVFDGEFLYLVPNRSNVMLRFDARTRAPLPSALPGAP